MFFLLLLALLLLTNVLMFGVLGQIDNAAVTLEIFFLLSCLLPVFPYIFFFSVHLVYRGVSS